MSRPLTTLRSRFRTTVALLLGMAMLSACDFDVYELPLPGGADVGDDPIEVTVEFADVLDLVPKSSVRVNDVAVGQVTEVRLDGYEAVVTLELRNDVDLPDNPIASIRQTSLLGEKFVSLASPSTGGQGQLSDGDVIENGGRNPEVEEVLGALSLVLNGGGVAQLKTIAGELNLALEGREDSAKSVLTQVESLVSQLSDRKQDIVDAIDAINNLAVTARQHQDSIDLALEELPSALESLDRQREDLVLMLEGLTELSDVGVRVIKTTKTSTINSLEALNPILFNLAKAGDDFVNGFSTFLTYPFIDEAVGRDPVVAANLHMGDYVNLSVDLQLDVGNLGIPDLVCIPVNELPDSPLDDLIDLKDLCSGVTKTLQSCLKTPPDPAACAKLPGYLIDNVCQAVKLLCGGLSGQAATSNRAISDLLGSVLDGGGLSRPAPGGDTQADDMWRTFDDTYDTDLVSIFGRPLVAAKGGTR
ncbi:MCE family protein [Nocardioides caeni]|uniref:MCE family protein n=1 Tax=Nocardioides caeni TaxID=574700 RepID=A0A4S8N907_9ACTN|nr:MCE family protein [Nocardioides caeni]THV12192.1 MCE family protein [Nocardioides caeni]